MEGYISLIEVSDKRWDSIVKLPVKFLQRFGQRSTFTVAGDELREMWGVPIQECGVPQPWRHMHHTHVTLAAAEKFAAASIEELERAIESLKPQGRVLYTLDLSGDGPLLPAAGITESGISDPF